MVQRINLTVVDDNADIFVHEECVAFPGTDGYARAAEYIKLQAGLVVAALKAYPDTALNRTLFHSSTPSVYAVQPHSGVMGVRTVPVSETEKQRLAALCGVTLFKDIIMRYGKIPPPVASTSKDSLRRCLIDQHNDDILGELTKNCWA